MSDFYSYRYKGELCGPLYPDTPIIARNYLFKLNNENDYLIESEFSDIPVRVYVLPTLRYIFLCDIVNELKKHDFEFDLILIRLRSAIPEPIPSTLLADNVFLSADPAPLLDLARGAGLRRTLYIGDRFRVKGVDDAGDNSIEVIISCNNDRSTDMGRIKAYFASRNINGEFECLR